MKIPKEAIERAIEGGWDGEWDVVLGPVKHLGNRNDTGWQIVALDPSFWQCLGKALRYAQGPQCTDENCRDPRHQADQCKEDAHRFYDLILIGGDTDAFWKGILANTTTV